MALARIRRRDAPGYVSLPAYGYGAKSTVEGGKNLDVSKNPTQSFPNSEATESVQENEHNSAALLHVRRLALRWKTG